MGPKHPVNRKTPSISNGFKYCCAINCSNNSGNEATHPSTLDRMKLKFHTFPNPLRTFSIFNKRKFIKSFVLLGVCVAVLLLVVNFWVLEGRASPSTWNRLVGTRQSEYLSMEESLLKDLFVRLVTSLQNNANVKVDKEENVRVIKAVLSLLETDADKPRFLEWASRYLTSEKEGHIMLTREVTSAGYDVTSRTLTLGRGSRSRFPPDAKPNHQHPLNGTTAEEQLGREMIGQDRVSLGICPEKSPYLVGVLPGHTEEMSMDLLSALFNGSNRNSRYPAIEMGGRYKPVECQAAQKVAIVIPYRNRYQHLLILLRNLIPILRRQQSDFGIFVIEQNLPTIFNRGMLQNIGFLEALKRDHFDCFVFHDVDMMPLNDHCLYRCPDNPLHLASAINKFRYGVPYHHYFGGVTAFTKHQYKAINGNSNLYFGWGGEDDDLSSRIFGRRYRKIRYPPDIGLYDMMQHTRDNGNHANPDRLRLLKTSQGRQDIEGLSTTKYHVTKMDLKPLITWVQVSINMTQVLETAPKITLDAIQILMDQAARIEKATNFMQLPAHGVKIII